MNINIIGLGGVGLKILRELAESGIKIKSIKLWDGDTIEERNLIRQIYKPVHIGMTKSHAAKDMFKNKIRNINAFSDMNEINLSSVDIRSDDVTFIATDNNESRIYLLSIWEKMQSEHVLISAANATADEGLGIGSTAWIYLNKWKNDPDKNPIIRNNLESNDNIHIGRPCSETSEPQTALANSGAAVRAVELLSLWKHPRSESISEYLPIEHSLFYKQTCI